MTAYMELKHRKPHQDTRQRLSNELMDVDPQSVAELKGMKFAPLHRPLHRRLETAAVLWHTVSIPIFFSFFFVMLANPLCWVLVLPYIIYWIQDSSASNGGVVSRYSDRLRGLEIWRHFCNFFPIRIHRTQELEPTWTYVEVKDDAYKFLWFKWRRKPYIKKVATGPRYIFGLHPHGVVSISAFGAIGTNGANWSKLFPGIPICVLTLINQFFVPVYRDYLLALGISSAARGNILKILEQNHSVAIVVGGAQEALLSRPGGNDIVLEKRKGFVKLALESGNTQLVPCYCFGENELYNVVDMGDDSTGRKVQFWLKQRFGFTIPFFHARGIFNYDFGLLPWRKPVTLVMGKPIEVPHKPNPNKNEVDHYHKLYVESLKKLFDDHKSQFLENGADLVLNIVE